MRTTLQAILKSGELGSMSIAKLRIALEQALELQQGSLEDQKEQVNRVMKEELLRALSEKKRKVAEKQEADPPAKKAQITEETHADKGNSGEIAKDMGDKQSAETAGDEPPTGDKPSTETAGDEPPTGDKPPTESEEPRKHHKARRAVSGGDDGRLRHWDLNGCTCLSSWEAHSSQICAIDVDWETSRVLSTAEDGLRMWSLEGELHMSLGVTDSCCKVVSVDWTAMTALGGCEDGKLRVWDMIHGRLFKTVDAHPEGIWTLHADWKNKRAASGGDDEFKVWDLETWAILHRIEVLSDGITAMSVDWEDCSRALIGVGSAEMSLRMWDLENPTSKPKLLLGHLGTVSCVFADWDEDVAISAGWDAQLRVWDLHKKSNSASHTVKFGRIRCMSPSFSSMQALCGSSKGTLHLINLRSGEELRQFEAHVGAVSALQADY